MKSKGDITEFALKQSRTALLLASLVMLPNMSLAGEFKADYGNSMFTNGLARFSLGNNQFGLKYGFVDRDGKVAIQPTFQNVGFFSENLAPASLDGKWGFIDQSGNWTIQPKFERVGGFSSDGLASIKLNGKWGFIDKAGKVIIPPQFDEVGRFKDGLAYAVAGVKSGYLDIQGNWVATPEVTTAKRLTVGSIPPNVPFHYGTRRNDLGQIMSSYRVGEVIPNEMVMFVQAGEFKEDVAIAYFSGGTEWLSSCGYIDKTGSWIIEPIFANCGSFSEGLASVRFGQDRSGDVTGFINKSGKFVFANRTLNNLNETIRYLLDLRVAKSEVAMKGLEKKWERDPRLSNDYAIEHASEIARKKFEEEAKSKAASLRAKEEAIRKANEDRQIASFRKSLQEGDESNCGAIIEMKAKLVKVAFPVAGYGGEHWIRREQIFPVGYGCRFINGQYQPPQ